MLTELTLIKTNYNNFGGPLPTELGYLTALYHIGLTGNKHTGSIPTEFDKLTGMEWFYLKHNHLQGQLPSELGRMEKLKYFWFQGNDLTGSVDTIFCVNQTTYVVDLRGDCLIDPPGVNCTCCTHCCSADGETCQPN
jgi:hypothetical protein